MKKLVLSATVAFAATLILGAGGAAAAMANYCAAPPFVVRAVPPNIMIVIDVSGSMQYPAYGPANFTGYDAQNVALCGSSLNAYDGAQLYYGYFRTDRFYRYEGTKFVENGVCSAAEMADKHAWGADRIPGNLLNWATMSRIDVLRKVLIGGKSVSQQTNAHTLLSDGGTWQFIDSSLQCTFTVTGQNNLAHTLSIDNRSSDCDLPILTDANVKVDVPDAVRTGVVQHIADRDYDGDWDDNAPRFGLMVYAGDNREGQILTGIAGSNMSNFLNALQGATPYGSTPTGEALINALDYFEQDACTYYPNSAYIGGPGSNKDPWLDWCQLSFILLVTDAMWNGAIDPVVPAREGRLGIHEGRSHDLRTDLDGVQVVTTYTVYAFSDSADGRTTLQQTAIYGGFLDQDSNDWPYPYDAYPTPDSGDPTYALPHSSCDPSGTYEDSCNEWDESGDGLPENYYEAQEGSDLEEKITQAIYDILKHATSGTAVSVLSTSAEGEGSLFQAYFNASVFEGARELTWIGHLNALWVDQYGNLREDTNGDKRLVLAQDYIIRYQTDFSTGDTIVKRYQDADGDGQIDDTNANSQIDDGDAVDTITLAQLSPIWEGGKELAKTDAANRTIYTFVDADGDGVKDTGEWAYDTFLSTNASTLRPYLGAATVADAEGIIRFIRGEHIDGLRDRRLTVDGALRVCKLGDIVNSTPTVLSSPMEGFHLIYGDTTYLSFYQQYKDRKTVVFAGANDGMLHAFNAGYYHEGDDSATGAVVEQGWYSGSDIGKELWAYIPYNLLSHLRWLADPDYCHVYYVDLKPKLVDARIFADDASHPNGWGTVLIGGMRFGGAPISLTDTFNGSSETRTFRSAYFAIDVTDPDNPNLLWEYTDTSGDLGFTSSYPAVVRVGSRTGVGSWYLILGSGPTTFDGGSGQTGYIYVLDLASGQLLRKVAITSVDTALVGTTAFMGDPISVDLRLDYQVDVAYIGASYLGGDWDGKLFRIKTNQDTDPSNWEVSTFISVSEPVTTAPTAALDPADRLWIFWGTGRFFSTTDKIDTSEQRLYGVWDPTIGGTGPVTVDVASLNDVTNVSVYEHGHMDNGDTFQNYLTTVRGTYTNGQKYGWYVRLSNGERALTKPTVIGSVILWPTFKPTDDVCAYGGDSYLYALYYETGTAWGESVMGLGTNTITVAGEDHKEILTKISLGSGMPTNAAIHVGKQEGMVSIIQLGTGVVKQINITPVTSPKSRGLFWREVR